MVTNLKGRENALSDPRSVDIPSFRLRAYAEGSQGMESVRTSWREDGALRSMATRGLAAAVCRSRLLLRQPVSKNSKRKIVRVAFSLKPVKLRPTLILKIYFKLFLFFSFI